ncbi:MAG: aminopeptidase [Bacteroidetes bacterium HGW-Bacteroidetes-6]|jgi:bleomycin hydrolase|nr:MAG: aminopeptidase [Bacteroidetes bacterium HGW-Bacteroidetes-6]
MKTIALFVIFFTIIIQVSGQGLFDTLALVPHTTVKDQQSSGTCWSFATTSFIESELIRTNHISLDLSEMFFVYYSLVAKAEMHVRMQGNNFFTPGGQMHDIMNVVQQHGLMPEEAYGGYTTEENGHNHALLDTALAHYMNQISRLKFPELPANRNTIVDSIISLYLGIPPQNFNFHGKKWNSKEFCDSAGFNPDEYITLTSYSHHPYYSWFVLEDRYNWSNGLYYNVPPDVFVQLCDSALLKGYSFVWDGDVSEVGFRPETGVASLSLTQKANIETLRQIMFNNHETTVDHVMHIVGKLRKYNGDEYYLVKNSWGLYGKYKGYILMSCDYFLLKTVAVMMNKNAIPDYIFKQ